MVTLVSFHAHPDDEVFACGGTLAKAAADGHRVVLVTATRGENGEVGEGVLGPGESLGERRERETLEAARILGVSRVEFLGYRDSGTTGAPTNGDARSFWQADVETVARRVAEILVEEEAEVFTIYDPVGITGHPDHIQVHRVGLRAAALAATPRLYEATMSRTQARRLVAAVQASGAAEAPIDLDVERFGTPDERITTLVDVRDYLAVKRRAMEAHASQTHEASPLLAMPDDVFAQVWGWESFVRHGASPAAAEASVFQEER